MKFIVRVSVFCFQSVTIVLYSRRQNHTFCCIRVNGIIRFLRRSLMISVVLLHTSNNLNFFCICLFQHKSQSYQWYGCSN